MKYLLIIISFCLFSFGNNINGQTLRDPGQQNNKSTETVSSNESETESKSNGEVKNFKVISEKKDSKTGVWTRVVEFEQDGLKVTQTIITQFPGLKDRIPVNLDTMNLDSVIVLVDKTNYLVAVLYKRKRIRQYRATFGPNRMEDKFQEGDRRTPEGWFRILDVRNHGAWQKFMLLDYPNNVSYKRFNTRKSNGEISSNAKIGYGIGIHGTFSGGNDMVDMGIGWTDGCVALKSTDIYDLARFCKKGTRVLIRGKKH